MNKTLIAIAAAAMLSVNSAGAETAISRALNACGKLNGAPYHACLDRIPKCEEVLTRDVDDYWHKGMVFDISGGSDDPGQLCQHMGSCIPISAVRFKAACMLVFQKTPGRPPYYHWEPENGSLSNEARHATGQLGHFSIDGESFDDGGIHSFKDALKYCTNNPDARESGRADGSMLSVRACANRIVMATIT